jgi:hypothetical protein
MALLIIILAFIATGVIFLVGAYLAVAMLEIYDYIYYKVKGYGGNSW